MRYRIPLIIINIAAVSICFSSVILSFILNNKYLDQKFSEQARSFLNGQLDVGHAMDTTPYNGKYYWPQGPFPSVIIMPFAAIFGQSFDQIKMQLILIPLLIFIVYKLTRNTGFNRADSFYLTYAFLFSSIIIGLIVDAGNVYYAQIVAIILLLMILWEFQTKRRWILLGLLVAALIATRPTAVLIILLLLYYAFKSKNILRNLTLLASPIIISIILLLMFNYARFNNFFDNGYYTNYVGEALIPFRNMGIFSLVHIPTNFYYYFLKSFKLVTNGGFNLVFPYLTYNTWGISFFIISPFFLCAFKIIKLNDKYIRLLWIICGLTLFLILTYYAPGWVQFGPRYTADFLPLLYIILLHSLKGGLKTSHKIIIMVSSIINGLLLLSKVYLASIGSFSYY